MLLYQAGLLFSDFFQNEHPKHLEFKDSEEYCWKQCDFA